MSSGSSDRESRIEQIVEQYIDDLQAGSAVSRDELSGRHPELNPELEQRLRLVTAVAGVFDPPAEKTVSLLAAVNHLKCPHCGIQVRIVHDSSSLICRSCGSSFALHDEPPRSAGGLDVLQDRFQFIERLGRGSFGVVHLARDMRLQREVAVKVPRRGSFDTLRERNEFLREARNAAELEHPNIVRVYEVGDEAAYIVSEFIRGRTLRQCTGSRRLDFREAAQTVATVAHAVHFAHSRGVIHRDIKPSNILMDENGEPHVADFGLAFRLGATFTISHDGEVIGTPAYMSPEQADAKRADVRSDVYSIGVVLYWTLTGVLPFRGSQQMLLHQVLEEDPQPPRAVNELIPRDLEIITLRAMSKEPADRFATAEEFAEELKRWLEGRAIVSRPVSAGEKIWKWCRRNPVWTTLSGLIGVLLCCVVVLFAQRFRAEAQLVEQRETALSGVADNLTVRALEEANGISPVQSLPHLVEALQMQQTLEQPEKAQRTRQIIGQTMELFPAVTHFAALDQRADELKYFPASKQLFVCYGTRIDRVSTDSWETASSMQLADRTRELVFNTTGDRMISLPSQIVEITSESTPSQSRQTELWDTTGGQRLALLEIEGMTSDATFVRNDSVVVTCRTQGSAYAWDANSGALLAVLQMPGDLTTHVWPSPDGESVYVDARYYDGRPSRITRFSTDNWQPTAQYQLDRGVDYADTLIFGEQITAVTRYGDLVVLAAESEDSDIARGDADTPEKTTSIADLVDGSDEVHSIQQLTPQLLALKTNTEVFTWDLQQQKRRYTLASGDATKERLFEVSANGLIYAVMKDPETLAVRWVDDGHPVCTSLPVSGGVTAVTIADNRFVAIATEDGALTVWDLAGFLRGRQPLLCGQHAKSPAFVPDGSAMMAIVDDTLHVWSAGPSAEPLWTAGAAVAAVSATGQIATVLDSQIELHDPATGDVTKLLQMESDVTHLVFAVDNPRVVIAGQSDGKLTVWNTQQDSVVSIVAHTSPVTALASGAGGMVASGGEDGVIRRWNIADGSALGEPLACDPMVRSLSFSADGRRLGATRINEYQIWQAGSGKLLHTGNTSASRAGVLFDDNSPDYWAAGSDSQLARWSGLHERVATADGREVTRVARSQDASLLAFNGRRDGANSLSLIFGDDLTLTAPPLPFRSGAQVAFAPDGQSLLAATYTGRVDLIRIVTTKLPVADLEHLCSVMTHDRYVDNVLTRIPALQIRDEFRQLKIDQPKQLNTTDEDVARWNIRLQQERDNLHWQPATVQ